jgi:hypothetical protein
MITKGLRSLMIIKSAVSIQVWARIAKVISVFVVVWCDEYFSIVVAWVDLSLNGFF